MQAAVGVLLFALFLYLGQVKRLEPFYTYSYLFAWIPFIWVVDRTVAARTRESLLADGRRFAWTAFLSTTVWLIFEVINFRLQNWVYLGLPAERWIRWPGYALSFATVIPGILLIRKLIESYMGPSLPRALFVHLERPHAWMTLGMAMLLLPVVWPRLFFPLVWGAFFFLFDPWVDKNGGHSLLADWKAGRWRRTVTLLGAGFVCGLFWESCNFGAGGKWQYTLPYWEFARLFEMPLLGFIGFLPFALEIHAFHEAARIGWHRSRPFKRRLILVMALLFWIATFTGIDHRTVISWR